MAQAEENTEAVVNDHEEDAEPTLFVVNTVRRWQTRGLRRRPGGRRSRFNLIMCGGKLRLLRGKSRPLPRELFEQFREELAARMLRGEIDIRVGGPNGESIGMPEEVPRDDSPKKDVPAEDSAGAGVESPSDEASEGESEEELAASEEEVEVSEDEPEDAEELDEEEPEEEPEEEEEEEEIPEPSKPIERMNKTELIDYCVQVTGMDPADLEGMVKREILEAIQGALKS